MLIPKKSKVPFEMKPFALESRLMNAVIPRFSLEFENSVMKRLKQTVAMQPFSIWVSLSQYYRPILITGTLIILITLTLNLFINKSATPDISNINGLNFEVLLADSAH